jgi:hypothetical protein
MQAPAINLGCVLKVTGQETVVSILLDIAKGLEHLHCKGVIHGGTFPERFGFRLGLVVTHWTATYFDLSADAVVVVVGKFRD